MARDTSSEQAARFARSILTRNLKVRPGENVTIEGWSHALPWAVALAREARRLKAHPLVLYEDEESFWDAVDHREEASFGASPSHEWAALAKTDVYIHMWGPGDKVRLGTLPVKRQERILAWNGAWYKAAAKAGLRGARLEVGRPYPSLAKVYGVDEEGWRDQVMAASMVDPEKLQTTGDRIAKALKGGRRVRIWDNQGTDLTLGLLGRPVRVNAGLITPEERKRPYGMMTSLPSGAVSVALDESVADGRISANRSSYLDDGKATGGVLEFRNGRLVAQQFDTGGSLFEGPYRRGGKGRDQPGQLRIGLNPKLHDTPQLEDIEAGAITVSVGGNGHLPGGKNTSRYFGFVVNAGAHLEIDGKSIL